MTLSGMNLRPSGLWRNASTNGTTAYCTNMCVCVCVGVGLYY